MTESNFNELNEIRNALGWDESTNLGEVVITPEIANKLLVFNTDNRRVNKGVVDRYAQSLIDGKFSESNDMITFNSAGVLTNGQHRLFAVTQSRCNLNATVKIGVEQSSEMDRGLVRNSIENIKRWADIPDNLRTNDAVGASNTLLSRMGNRKRFNNAKLEKFMRDNEETITIAYKNGLIQCTGPVRKVFSNTISSAFLAAVFYYRDKYSDNEEKFSAVMNDLSHIRTVLTTGICDKEIDQFVIRLRDKIKDTNSVTKRGTLDELFRSVQYVIYNYCAGTPKSKIYHDKDYFI